MKDRLTHEEAVLLLNQCQEIIFERDAEIARLRTDAERYHYVLEHGMPHQGGNCCWYLDGKRFSTAEEAIDAGILKTPNRR